MNIASAASDSEVQEIGKVQKSVKRKSQRSVAEQVRTGLAFVWKWIVGMVFCQTPVTAVIVLGWTLRVMRRETVKVCGRQFRRAGQASRVWKDSFCVEPGPAGLIYWPNWFFSQEPLNELLKGNQGAGMVVRFRKVLRRLLGSLGANARLGFAGTINVFALTLPGTLLMLFSWYAGWQNSFYKGYELAHIGPLTGILGILLWIAAMCYVPMAQARQAFLGDWRRFFDFGVVLALIRERWWSCLGLALLYSLLGVPVVVLRVVPYYFPQMNPAWAELSGTDAKELLNTYYFWCALWVFPAFVLLRTAAARIYGKAWIARLRRCGYQRLQLHGMERMVLEKGGGMECLPENPGRSGIWPQIGRGIGWVGCSAGVIFAVLCWFSLIAQVYIAQFLNYQPISGWLNHPLVQIPWFHFIPSGM